MKKRRGDPEVIKASQFPLSICFVFLATLLLMSGIHTGLILLANEEE